jgi:hypothetical protein
MVDVELKQPTKGFSTLNGVPIDRYSKRKLLTIIAELDARVKAVSNFAVKLTANVMFENPNSMILKTDVNDELRNSVLSAMTDIKFQKKDYSLLSSIKRYFRIKKFFKETGIEFEDNYVSSPPLHSVKREEEICSPKDQQDKNGEESSAE